MTSFKNWDQLRLNGIQAYGYTGALPEEQVLGQWFEVDLVLYLDLRPAGQSDDLADTVDYRDLIRAVQTLMGQRRFALVERLAAAIADEVLSGDSIAGVQVCLTKKSPPIPNFAGNIQVQLRRMKGE